MGGHHSRLPRPRLAALACAGLLALAGCDDPLRGVERVSESGIAVGDTATAAAMAPTGDAPTLGGPGFLGQLFGRGGGGGTTAAAAQPGPGPDGARVPRGMAVPYGRVATNCEVSGRALGRRVARQSGFEIWDTAPGMTTLRTHYITGFSDGCARQFSGALVLMGDVGTHELVRYSDVNLNQRWSEVDNAYEAIKGRVCGARRGAPCGGRLDRLGADTAFVTVYERFGAGPDWVEILLHDGALAAVDREGL